MHLPAGNQGVTYQENLILGIESSCDETAAAVVADGRVVRSNVVASQVAIHRKYGGVVPELASREHLRQIVPVVREALDQAQVTFPQLSAVAVTRGPGLIGALLVGVTYGKSVAQALGKPLIGVNHLEGHVHAVFLDAHAAGRVPMMPAICLIVSGGHTILYQVRSESSNGAPHFSYARIGGTRDDAAGEAYDKGARMLALGYPGGPVIDQLAAHGNPTVIRFSEPKMRGNVYDFSFSGIKTALLYHLKRNAELQPEIEARQKALARGERNADQLRALCTQPTLDLIASFQRAVVCNLVNRTLAAAEQQATRTILVSGGVAANSELRRVFESEGSARGLDVFFPSRILSTDNAAMIAAAAYPRLLAGLVEDLTLNAEANLPLA
ncbi:MAG TPA: tRNA (adenosine(37)-N6)-threonylcarbamoyltransferase complex transferase subunit TsaD [Candidatus Acidoferrales bacterium]|jgi:N6-L-threonylcarbamoyladenine synthase|nr:tRNA (adenosine(37)-N6)-threonylcarbamoyltransferase complex transferase subunit TsaD [Candidatus Acidoferrales bacterium]